MGVDPIATRLDTLEANIKSEIKKEKRLVGVGVPLLVILIGSIFTYCGNQKQTSLNNNLQDKIQKEQAQLNNQLQAHLTN